MCTVLLQTGFNPTTVNTYIRVLCTLMISHSIHSIMSKVSDESYKSQNSQFMVNDSPVAIYETMWKK